MSYLLTPVRTIDALNRRLGRWVAWLMPTMALVTTVVVILRYGFAIGAIAAQEGVLYLHATAFLLGSSYTLLQDQHVRVDIFYRQFSPRSRAWVNAAGHVVFTLPVCALIALGSLDYVSEAWRIRESSPEPGGIPAVYLLKTLIPTMATLLGLQAVSETLKALAILVTAEEGGSLD